MRIGKILLVMTLLSAFLLPQLAFAVVGGGSEYGDGEFDLSGDIKDRRGPVRWFGDGTLFWPQLIKLFRHLARWNHNLAMFK